MKKKIIINTKALHRKIKIVIIYFPEIPVITPESIIFEYIKQANILISREIKRSSIKAYFHNNNYFRFCVHNTHLSALCFNLRKLNHSSFIEKHEFH